ncbi:glycine--tRNA ligase [Candidatus Falkowbacteria bacterium RIFOXYB2_FULL_34_18]|uniref:Glycine--tRNA ligase n=1 Tax=Candidatus Falkowbacteria bacterium RIFOXYD2_FULL_34_120 TaxID=1798007 RepID=A0A1F5TNY7_9BACT|nr:MAG: glycine--tRNA ligase [Candidatus Falkowbacteria bacterium RIFOXYB2_FULL_34_18]OGF29032.1 MAG: glycine--tRNA ligase [Candidatus Falkowbacteria bacterium RIFOXYC12_FULL_34_55]OGF36065.1 MAG: glycine--tRNA ligase [Candidatus Falkowbacteria bacterium RIFOXYC2_FULL_34_220]OGF38543.1 MAG: glycine--tRNA ligase [Candidatus Falkowbacteria bacterium RIFOXYD12_FULL_34_57]OGF40712.1 MAG: glycine--tRNA ligase [Candidatus Falkowbacteria bacterium RIFOXYD2_FULL_34_120]
MKKEQNDLMQKIVSLCKRRGFIYPSSEIYGGFAAVYDYGPYGVELENAVKREWWRAMVQLRDDIVGLDSSIFMHPRVWEASGHVGGFSDPLAECKNCHARLRVDHLLEDVGAAADEKMSEEEINKIFTEHKEKIKCPNCGKSDFSDAKKFNLLVKSNLGNFTGDWDKEPSYLRGETCQGIYINYKNILDSARVKVPFGIAQIGKAFRNEITARQFVFRTREFEQMEMQYFTHPENEMEEYEKLRQARWQYYLNLGFKEENIKWHKHENLVFYAKEAYDIEYNYPFGFKELEGVHARGNYDLSQHSKFSGQELNYIDPKTSEKYVPHIIESSVGVGRTVLAALCEAYTEEKMEDGERIVMKFPRKLAPVKIAVFPLLKNKPELVEKAREIYDLLKMDYMCEFDDNGNVGKRYRRQDEIGTPFCVTIDFDTIEKDNTVTVRDRDTMAQERVQVDELDKYFREKF